MKTHVLSYSMQIASGYHDIETVKFLLKNGVGLNNLSMIFYKDGLEINVSPIMAATGSWRKNSFFDQELIDLLFDNGLDLNIKIEEATAYYHIIGSAPEEFAIKMLDYIKDINETQLQCIGELNENNEEIERFEPSSYLENAIFSGHFELATAMIEKGAKIEKGEELKFLYNAVDKDNIKFVKYLFENEYITTLENLKGTETLLAKALLHNNYETFMLLVKKGANIEGKCDSSIYIRKDGILDIKSLYAPTIFAQVIKQAPEDIVVDILQLVNVDANAKLVDKYLSCTYETNNQDSYLHIALREKKYDVAKKLIELGADINLPFNGTTPIHIVLDNDELEFAQYLVKNGVDTSYIVKNVKQSALQKAFDSGNKDLTDCMIKHVIDKFGNNVLNRVISNNELKVVQLLLDAGADVSVVDNFGNTPLTMALPQQNPEILQLLLDAGADVNSKPEKSVDVWFWCRNNYKCAKIIVASGKLKLDGFDEYEIKKYNQIKAKMQFEQKALADIETIKSAHLECNEFSIKDSFVSKKTADSMLKYYLHGYKSKYKEQIEGAEGEFFTDLADTVVKHLKDYTQYNWPQIFGIAKTLVINNMTDSKENALHLPNEIIGEIGEYVFWLDVLDNN